MTIDRAQRALWSVMSTVTIVALLSLPGLAAQLTPAGRSGRQAESRNMALVGQHDLPGRSAYQLVI